MTDDRRTGTERAIDAAGAACRDAVDEFHLADRLHRLRPVGAVEGAALQEDRPDDIMPRLAAVAVQFLEQIARRLMRDDPEGVRAGRAPGQQRGQIPQVMMRIDDRKIRVENVLAHPCLLRFAINWR